MLLEKERNFLSSTWTIVSLCHTGLFRLIGGVIDIFLFSSAIVDTKPLLSGTLPSSECARPGLHDFLEL